MNQMSTKQLTLLLAKNLKRKLDLDEPIKDIDDAVDLIIMYLPDALGVDDELNLAG